ncbi:MAG: hypothetical protein V2J26_04015 [Pacificimonas sp.]|nr:hypothetical protein [Pacificimonas sp.]
MNWAAGDWGGRRGGCDRWARGEEAAGAADARAGTGNTKLSSLPDEEDDLSGIADKRED